ncbi:MAG: DivIVA domain-containing protein [Acidimicrobiaceae bacterium]|nr:DivIVA domain-containing protein [Acidimicrobiaceae bacterium]MXW61553.1 DivIVA domain-containing protein [Acidimicrobiaceae bacterium]MYA73958.1 DivIVA domain-containing protein [Acidimicrobiaceae bacterium]MYC42197.1 DivIVA domain-containing protein [Acidimicrobiaceae bacterium]MYJ98606.1 DivIVA domain-containing protein [Acidimicrobiaceae bacterium]
MDDLSSLLQVRFRESWRGYDPDEVDAYVDQVSNAISRAQEELASLAEQVEVGAPSSDDRSDSEVETSATDFEQTTEALAQTLASAQDAADELIAEAREQAEQIVTTAESQAEATIAGVHADAVQIRSEADEYAESTYANAEKLAKEREAAAAIEERKKYESEISELTAQRAQLAEDLELLERHVVEQRQEIERSLSKLTDLVMSPETFRIESAPSTEVAESKPDGDGRDEMGVLEVEDDSDRSVEAEPDGVIGLDAAAVFDDEIDSLQVDEPLKIAGEDSVASTDSANRQPRFVTAADLEEQRSIDEPTVQDEQIDSGPTMSQLFGEEELPQAVAAGRDEEPFLAQLREAASRDNMRIDSDDALSAFFNQDEDQRRSPWFLGGR